MCASILIVKPEYRRMNCHNVPTSLLMGLYRHLEKELVHHLDLAIDPGTGLAASHSVVFWVDRSAMLLVAESSAVAMGLQNLRKTCSIVMDTKPPTEAMQPAERKNPCIINQRSS